MLEAGTEGGNHQVERETLGSFLEAQREKESEIYHTRRFSFPLVSAQKLISSSSMVSTEKSIPLVSKEL